MARSPCCDKQGVKKGPWTPEEDMKLIQYIHTHGAGNWRLLPKNAGLERCGKSCRLRWTNYLRPDIKRGRFSFEEEETIIQLHSVLGNKWSAIAARLPGRTDNEIKNYWNTHIRKRLLRMGLDPVTHAPRLDLSDLSSILLRLQTQGLSLALSLLSSNADQNPNLLLDSHHLHPPFQPSHFENNVVHPSNISDSSLPIPQPPQSTQNNLPMNSPTSTAQALQHYLPSNETFPANLSHSFYGVSDQMKADLSETNSSFDSVLSTPTASTFINGTTQDEREISFCSDLLRFEIPESLELDYFM